METADFPVWGTDSLLYIGWSLHRLMEMSDWFSSLRLPLGDGDSPYEVIICHIEWLIKQGYFDKEYLA